MGRIEEEMTTAIVSTVLNASEHQLTNLERIFRETSADEKIIIDCGGGFSSSYADVVDVGYNAFYGPSIKIASSRISSDILVYVSSTRATMYDQSWISDIVRPLSDERCGMSGCLQPCEYNRIARYPTDIFEPQVHIQGGVFAIRNEVMKSVDYGKFPQVFSDVYLSWSLIRRGYYLQDVKSIRASAGGVSSIGKMRVGYHDRKLREEMFKELEDKPSDINEHMLILRLYAGRSSRVVEFGTRGGVSTLAFLAGQPDCLTTVDIDPRLVDIDHLKDHCGDTKFESIIANSLEYEIDRCDLLFIDTDHNYTQLSAELALHHSKVTRWIIMHDTESFPVCGEAYRDFLAKHGTEWKELVHYPNNNGLTILERIG
jgi:hypothetical protein